MTAGERALDVIDEIKPGEEPLSVTIGVIRAAIESAVAEERERCAGVVEAAIKSCQTIGACRMPVRVAEVIREERDE